MPIMGRTLPPATDGSPPPTAPEQGVQLDARRGVAAHLLQPVDVEERGDRGEPVDAVQDRRVLGAIDPGVDVGDVVAQDQQSSAGPQP